MQLDVRPLGVAKQQYVGFLVSDDAVLDGLNDLFGLGLALFTEVDVSPECLCFL